ncbi:ABC transporter substrate-binding protein, partial [Chloroflexota bacterium]
EKEMVTLRLTKQDGTIVEKSVEKPRYGGTFTFIAQRKPVSFDQGYASSMSLYPTVYQTNDLLARGPWAKGSAGTEEVDFLGSYYPPLAKQTGGLAESWELVEPDTIIYHIRKGVHFGLNPKSEASRLVGGREMTADDVVFSIKRVLEVPTAQVHLTMAPDTRPKSVEATDKYTVVLKVPPEYLAYVAELISEMTVIVPHEVIEKYGDMLDWRVSCGTGPFMLIDYVPDSSTIFEKNPNYWMKDPLHPENQLPYISRLNMLLIAEPSTKEAAFRTAKVDQLTTVSWEAAELLNRTNPELKWVRVINPSPYEIFMRTDTKPFDDKRVRRAMAMAVNNDEIADEYYGGNAAILAFPASPVTGHKDIYTPLEELPGSVRELFEYHPDKAKQLLAEAGYPNGFKTNIILYELYVDLASMYAAYWADIGIDAELVIKEYGVWASMVKKKTYTQMIIRHMSSAANAHKFLTWTPGRTQNLSIIDDQRVNETFTEIQKNYADPAKQSQLMKDLIPYMLDQCWMLQMPAEYFCTMWWPWVKNYHGERYIGYMATDTFPRYIWVDQDLRKDMTGR